MLVLKFVRQTYRHVEINEAEAEAGKSIHLSKAKALYIPFASVYALFLFISQRVIVLMNLHSKFLGIPGVQCDLFC
jgi:hypothetical protein